MLERIETPIRECMEYITLSICLGFNYLKGINQVRQSVTKSCRNRGVSMIC